MNYMADSGLGGHMNYMADSTAELRQGGKGRYDGRESVPTDNSSREKCKPVIVFDSLDLSVCQRAYVS